MSMTVLRADLILMEHVYFASREVGTLYETEPLIGNYALAYALGLCAAPYARKGSPRYQLDLAPLNQRGIYVTPATFAMDKLRYAFSQFNAQSDSYYFRFDPNAIGTDPGKKARAANFPQSGKLRMLGVESEATFYMLSEEEELMARLPSYIRLGKFDSKARILWSSLILEQEQPRAGTQDISFFLNAADLSDEHLKTLRAFTIYNMYPAPLLRQCRLQGLFWQARTAEGQSIVLPAGMRFGVENLAPVANT